MLAYYRVCGKYLLNKQNSRLDASKECHYLEEQEKKTKQNLQTSK
jgi:hypothetical protein